MATYHQTWGRRSRCGQTGKVHEGQRHRLDWEILLQLQQQQLIVDRFCLRLVKFNSRSCRDAVKWVWEKLDLDDEKLGITWWILKLGNRKNGKVQKLQTKKSSKLRKSWELTNNFMGFFFVIRQSIQIYSCLFLVLSISTFWSNH